MLWPHKSQFVINAFERDMKSVHLIYNYDAQNPENGAPEKWKYEMWFYNEDRIVYAINGGPMAGRINYQRVDYQCIREGELWQCNWLEEAAHGNKRNQVDLERWRKLANIGTQTNHHLLHEQATVVNKFKGRGGLEEIEMDWPTL
ncbi:hypothetical protein EJ05DRAFT_515589 [Pseudovirgaria hyperparasitica]|uniref:Phenolic acid decarboxylase n=1 Tax=Pseudovirgaria hyperparasitica TaxID=470096 RepID=A0A6A6VTC1_9PEZI|nr:uncharacterized protein EJ05DRAFT_515589 [Pseudovirgaria hyperparasitica]KAF2752521.1 hypothetical protein EJ05DRAFT_515589 [Pseudovirgaria hyperparasitica]